MNCLIEFLMDGYQKKLIGMIQNREETFQEALDSYKKLFIKELVHCVGRNLGKTVNLDNEEKGCLCRCKDSHCMHIDSCRNFYKVICEIPEAEIERFFDGIILCYTSWIDAKTTSALEGFEALLREYELLSDLSKELKIKNISKRVFFRARISENFLSKLEMFHVPFNKRYSIRNERFSLTGQPVLYLGNSIADLMEELNVNFEDENQVKNFRVASFEFNREKNIFDLRCNIFEDLKNCFNPTFKKKKFYRNILASICSFQKRRELAEYAFTEEYVIPQMFAQILKKNGYDGICYYSTKAFENYSVVCNSDRLLKTELSMAYRENLAVFTNMNASYSYDPVLRGDLEISMPVNLYNARFYGEDDLNGIIQTFSIEAEEAKKQKEKLKEKSASVEEITKNETVVKNFERAKSIVKFYNHVFHNLKYGEQEYSKTMFGRVQIQLLIGILNRLLAANINANLKEKEELPPPEQSTEKVTLCGLNGVESGTDSYHNVHLKGKLHKSYLGFVCSQENILIEVDIVHGGFYGHSVDKLLESNLESKFDFSKEKDDVKVIGNFIYHDYGISKHPEYAPFIENNFEYVEILVKKVDEEKINQSKGNIKSIEEYREKFLNLYDSLHPILQQALPLLFQSLEYENNRLEEGESGVEEDNNRD